MGSVRIFTHEVSIKVAKRCFRHEDVINCMLCHRRDFQDIMASSSRGQALHKRATVV